MDKLIPAGQGFYVIVPQISKGQMYGIRKMPVIGWAVNPSGEVTAITPRGPEPDAVVELPREYGYTMMPGVHFDGMLGAAEYLAEIRDLELGPELLRELEGKNGLCPVTD